MTTISLIQINTINAYGEAFITTIIYDDDNDGAVVDGDDDDDAHII